MANDAAFDSKTSVFYTIVRKNTRDNPDGKNDYLLVGFSVPQLVSTKVISVGEKLTEPPYFKLESGLPKIISAEELITKTKLDLSTYDPKDLRFANEILEEAGTTALLRVFTGKQHEVVLAVANQATKSVVVLKDLILTTALAVHLSPSGEVVWAEETDNDGNKTGKASLYDSKTGQKVKSFENPKIKTMVFASISPSGKAIYYSDDKYAFIDLGRKFAHGTTMQNSRKSMPMFYSIH